MEQWKHIKGYEGIYMVSSYGRVRSLDKTIIDSNGIIRKYKGKILSFNKDAKYPRVSLLKNTNYMFIHRLVAMAFIPNPKNKPQVNHIDGDPTNNNVSNLEWCTQSENNKHAFKIGLKSAKGVKNSQSLLTEKDVLNIRKEKGTQYEIAKKYNVSRGCINSILNKYTWKHI